MKELLKKHWGKIVIVGLVIVAGIVVIAVWWSQEGLTISNSEIKSSLNQRGVSAVVDIDTLISGNACNKYRKRFNADFATHRIRDANTKNGNCILYLRKNENTRFDYVLDPMFINLYSTDINGTTANRGRYPRNDTDLYDKQRGVLLANSTVWKKI